MGNETGNRNRIFEMFKFWIWFRLVHGGTITSVTRYGFRQILHADHKCDGFYIWCFRNHKPEVDVRVWRCADSDFRCFGLWFIVVVVSIIVGVRRWKVKVSVCLCVRQVWVVKSWVHVPAIRVIPQQTVHKMATTTPVTVSTVNSFFADSDILCDRRLLQYCFALYKLFS